MILPELEWLAILAYSTIGALGGLVAGLFGVGGGSVFGPLLLLAFELQGMSPKSAVVAAISTSCAAVLLTSMPSTTIHALHHNVRWGTVAVIAPTAFVGAVLGAQLAQLVPPLLLVLAMLTILLTSAWSLLLPQRRTVRPAAQLTGRTRMLQAGIGCFAGLSGAVTGTGGGILITPLLYRMGVPLRESIGTSAAITILVAMGSALSYFGHGVYLPALAVLSLMCAASAIAGARLANIMPINLLRYLFAVFLLIVCARITFWLVQTYILAPAMR